MSQVYEERKTQLLNSIIMSPEETPTKVFTFQPNTLYPTEVHDTQGRKRRSGQPRVKWVDTALDNLWQLIKKDFPEFKYEKMNLDKDEHINIIIKVAQQNLHEFSPSFLLPTGIRQQQAFINNRWVPLATTTT